MLRGTVLVAMLAGIPAVGPAHAAGTVTLTLVSDMLSIVGDDASNAVTITGTGIDGEFVVTGDAGTLVDGTASVLVGGVQQLQIEPGDGADDVTLSQVAVPGKVKVLLGDGDDDLIISQCRLEGRLVVRGGRGSDVVIVEERTRVGRTNIQTQQGTDTVVIDDTDMDGNLTVSSGGGYDRIEVYDVRANGSAKLQLYAGNGEDTVRIVGTTVGGDTTVSLGSQDDLLVLADSLFYEDAHFDGNDGDNALVLGGFIGFDDDEDVDFSDFD